MEACHICSASQVRLNGAPMVAGAVLVGAGSLMGLAGLILGGTGMISAVRCWFRELEAVSNEAVTQGSGWAKAPTAVGDSASKRHAGARAIRAGV